MAAHVNWKHLRGRLMAKFGKLTDDDLNVEEGTAEYLAGRLQERYGWTHERALEEVRDWEASNEVTLSVEGR